MLTETGDRALALAAAGGDLQAFERLVTQHYALIFRVGCRVLGDPAEAEDLAQDVAVGLARKIRGFRGEAAFTTWLYRLVVNAALDRRRKAGRQARLVESFAETDALRRAADEARSAEVDWLARALQALSPELRATAALVLEEELTQAQTAEVLGIAEGTVAWRMAEIKRKLRALAKAGEDAEI
ncbi:MAG: RNA polymerase sigma factor [Pseudomonadota bacterium]